MPPSEIPDPPAPHRRRSIRLHGYGYTQTGAYFITLVTHERREIFGEIVEGIMRLNAVGKIIQNEWESLPLRFPFIQLDAFVIMPNHVHAVIVFNDLSVGATHPHQSEPPTARHEFLNNTPSGQNGSPRPPRPTGPLHASLGAVIGQFKSRITRRLWHNPEWTGVPIWQRNYFDRIIRDENEHQRITLYIEGNPERWSTDEENPLKNPQPI